MWTWAIAAAFAAAEADPELTRQLAVGIEAGDPASVRQLVTRLVWLEDAVQALQSELAEWRASQPKASCSGSPEAADDKCKEMKAAGEHCAVAKRAGCGLTSIRKAGYTATEARAAGFTLAEMEDAGYVEGLMAAGYTAQEAKEAGYSSGEAKVAGFVHSTFFCELGINK